MKGVNPVHAQEQTKSVAPVFGQYSLISYMHQLRGERINLGIVVWHPSLGSDIRLAKNLQRVRVIDEHADLDRVRSALERVRETIDKWSRSDQSPLEVLAREFRHNFVVSEPLNARICTPACTLERLYTSLIAPEPFMRASPTRIFSLAFASRLSAALQTKGITEIRTNFVEEATFQPVRVTASYMVRKKIYLWRAFSFAPHGTAEQQLQMAKAIHAENLDLKALKKYQHGVLDIAVQLPKPAARAEWPKASRWLERITDRVEVFEDKQSLEEKIPKLVKTL